MTRIKISICIVVAMILFSIFSGTWINNRCQSLIDLSEQAGVLFSAGEKQQAVETTELIETDWENFRKYASVLLLNNKLSEIDCVCARIKYLAENDSDELMSELSELEDMLDMLRNGEIPRWTSVF